MDGESTNVFAKITNCFGYEETMVKKPLDSLLKPISFELRSIQYLASQARRTQMQQLLDMEERMYTEELNLMNKSLLLDHTCPDALCYGYGCKMVKS